MFHQVPLPDRMRGVNTRSGCTSKDAELVQVISNIMCLKI